MIESVLKTDPNVIPQVSVNRQVFIKLELISTNH